jgi:serine/threonine protein phosphatase PrpC
MKDAHIYLDAQMDAVEAHAAAGGRTAVFSRRSPVKATPNEDSAALFVIDDATVVLVVADGLGGGPAGDQASGIAVAALRDSLQNVAETGEQVRTAILDGIEAANRQIQAVAPNAATTLAVVEVQDGKMRTYHIGDSAILAVSQRGRLKLQTVAHSPVGYAVEAGVLNEAEAMHHEARHVVSNVLGTPTMRVEMGAFVKLRPRDTVVLASDGLFDNLHTEEIVARIRTGELAAGVERLARDATARMLDPGSSTPSKPDDLTIVAFRPTPP